MPQSAGVVSSPGGVDLGAETLPLPDAVEPAEGPGGRGKRLRTHEVANKQPPRGRARGGKPTQERGDEESGSEDPAPPRKLAGQQRGPAPATRQTAGKKGAGGKAAGSKRAAGMRPAGGPSPAEEMEQQAEALRLAERGPHSQAKKVPAPKARASSVEEEAAERPRAPPTAVVPAVAATAPPFAAPALLLPAPIGSVPAAHVGGLPGTIPCSAALPPQATMLMPPQMQYNTNNMPWMQPFGGQAGGAGANAIIPGGAQPMQFNSLVSQPQVAGWQQPWSQSMATWQAQAPMMQQHMPQQTIPQWVLLQRFDEIEAARRADNFRMMIYNGRYS